MYNKNWKKGMAKHPTKTKTLETDMNSDMNFTDRQKMLVELCVRHMLCDLLNKDEQTIQDFTAGLHNLNVGSFGEKGYKFEDTNDWVACLEDLREIVAILDPIYHQRKLELGDQPYELEEEHDFKG